MLEKLRPEGSNVKLLLKGSKARIPSDGSIGYYGTQYWTAGRASVVSAIVECKVQILTPLDRFQSGVADHHQVHVAGGLAGTAGE
jgi:hypothetical protein